MAFIADKQELKPGLIIFRRTDVAHRRWYCRVKVGTTGRYKTISLRTSDPDAARDQAYDQASEIRTLIKHDHPVFNRSFRDVAREYLLTQEARAKRGEISVARPKKLKAVIESALERYVGSTQVHRIGDESWAGYPAWRRVNGAGRNKRNGVREVSDELAEELASQDAAAKAKAMRARGIRRVVAKPRRCGQLDSDVEAGGATAESARQDRTVAFISDATIKFEMSIFGAVMNYAIKKRYVPASQRFDDRPKLKTMRRDEFTVEEYRKLHSVGRAWIAKATKAPSVWYRTMTYNFVLVMCNTGMRPSEAKNLRWRDIMAAKDKDGHEIVVLFVQGKGKSRKLVAPKSVGGYLDRIRAIAKATDPDDRVFTTITGEPALSLYKHLIEDLLTDADLREGAHGVPRSTYCFRHTYATFRLQHGVDVYFLAEQMGTSVKMIEDHYGHVNTIKHADRVLQGMAEWEPAVAGPASAQIDAAKACATRDKAARPAPQSRRRATGRRSS